jgi:hypothetical protein
VDVVDLVGFADSADSLSQIDLGLGGLNRFAYLSKDSKVTYLGQVRPVHLGGHCFDAWVLDFAELGNIYICCYGQRNCCSTVEMQGSSVIGRGTE